jgi:hypothetical protein
VVPGWLLHVHVGLLDAEGDKAGVSLPLQRHGLIQVCTILLCKKFFFFQLTTIFIQVLLKGLSSEN